MKKTELKNILAANLIDDEIVIEDQDEKAIIEDKIIEIEEEKM